MPASPCPRRSGAAAPTSSADMTGPYDDIIDLPRPVSKKHSPMPLNKRAAQFLPFAALTGFEGEIAEAGRLTEAALAALDAQLTLLRQRLSGQPAVTITRFVPDERKIGGRFETLTGQARRLDETNRLLLLADGTKIDIDTVVELLV